MKKAIIVEYLFMTRIVIDEENENLETIVAETKQKILDKVNNELSENLCEWYDDEEMPYDAENELAVNNKIIDIGNTENKDRGAFPCIDSDYIQEGLTKREYFASQAMQGYIVQRHAQNESDMQKIAKWSVRMADELLKALANER